MTDRIHERFLTLRWATYPSTSPRPSRRIMRRMARAHSITLPAPTADQEEYLKKIGGYMTAEEIAADKSRIRSSR